MTFEELEQMTQNKSLYAGRSRSVGRTPIDDDAVYGDLDKSDA